MVGVFRFPEPPSHTARSCAAGMPVTLALPARCPSTLPTHSTLTARRRAAGMTVSLALPALYGFPLRCAPAGAELDVSAATLTWMVPSGELKPGYQVSSDERVCRGEGVTGAWLGACLGG
eukprot:230186-Chlamydomonas_euryale.AAC.2